MIDALNNHKSRYFFLSYTKLQNVNIISLDAFRGVTPRQSSMPFPMPPSVNVAVKDIVTVKAFGKLLNFLISEV